MQRVGEDQPAFGVGVDDLDRLAVRGAQDVAGLERVAVLQFSVDATTASTRTGSPSSAIAAVA